MKVDLPIKLFILSSFLLLFNFTVAAQEEEEMMEMPESNGVCLKCHADRYYSFYNEYTEKEERGFMNPYHVIDSMNYLKGEHQQLACTDCHSPDYEKYPHTAELKIEPKFSCTDCHDFEEIAEEVQKSVHVEAFGDAFDCALCHDPHSNKLVKSDMEELIRYNNNRCLNCHNDVDKYQMFTTHEKPQILATHDWLPNKELHFARVRCIECHTSVTDTAIFVHNIVPKEQAVRNCRECHSESSHLRDKLYKHQVKQERKELKFYKSFILNDAYIIGANRNYYVNLITLIVFGCTLLGIGIHIVLRIIKRK